MDAAAVFLSLILALIALAQGRWLPIAIFDATGVFLGWGNIPLVFGLIAAFNIGWALFLRRHPGAGHRLGLE